MIYSLYSKKNIFIYINIFNYCDYNIKLYININILLIIVIKIYIIYINEHSLKIIHLTKVLNIYYNIYFRDYFTIIFINI